MQMSRQHLQRTFQLSVADPLLESPVAGLIRRIFLRQFAPLCAGTQHPEHAVQHGPRIVPRSAAVILTPLGSQHPLHHGPLFVGQFPASRHRRVRRSQSSPRIARKRLSGIYETGSRERRVAAEFLNPNTVSQLPRQLARWEIEQAMREAYALDKNIYPEGLELRMRQILGDQIDQFLHLIAGSRKRWLTEVLQPTPMMSLRDVDVGVRFRPHENADYRDMQWFNTENS
jgi:hypothetical protein